MVRAPKLKKTNSINYFIRLYPNFQNIGEVFGFLSHIGNQKSVLGLIKLQLGAASQKVYTFNIHLLGISTIRTESFYIYFSFHGPIHIKA